MPTTLPSQNQLILLNHSELLLDCSVLYHDVISGEFGYASRREHQRCGLPMRVPQFLVKILPFVELPSSMCVNHSPAQNPLPNNLEVQWKRNQILLANWGDPGALKQSLHEGIGHELD